MQERITLLSDKPDSLAIRSRCSRSSTVSRTERNLIFCLHLSSPFSARRRHWGQGEFPLQAHLSYKCYACAIAAEGGGGLAALGAAIFKR